MKNHNIYNVKTYSTKSSKCVLFFVCPFGVKNWHSIPVIKVLQKAGYNVISYDVTKDVFYSGNPELLGEVIKEVKHDINKRMEKYKQKGVDDFGFFGSSLGTFILYNCLSDLDDLRWGVFNTGGNIARGMWNFSKARHRHEAKRISLDELEARWYDLQHPKFSNLKGHRYLFVSSHADEIVPLDEIEQYLPEMRKAGAIVSIKEIKATSHLTSVIVGLCKAAKLLDEVRS